MATSARESAEDFNHPVLGAEDVLAGHLAGSGLIPYDLACSLRNLALSASWHAANRRAYGDGSQDAMHDRSNFVRVRDYIKASIGDPVGDAMGRMAESYGWHTANRRWFGDNNADAAENLANAMLARDELLNGTAVSPSDVSIEDGVVPEEVVHLFEELCLAAAWFASNTRKGYKSDAKNDLVRMVRAFDALYVSRTRGKWLGVNLGGWLIMEKGPSMPFYEEHGVETEDEWQLCVQLREMLGSGAKDAFARHRAQHITEDTFAHIARLGLSAVRLPFGYWIVSGPTHGEPFYGPAMSHIDDVVRWATTHGLQVLLDLHANPGGESTERPCGRINPNWTFDHWRRPEALQILRLVAERYKDCPCVTGIEICNEPSASVLPSASIRPEALVAHYVVAAKVVRDAGMPAHRVAIVCPFWYHFPWQKSAFLTHWRDQVMRGNLDHCVLDMHFYHFEVWNKEILPFNGPLLAHVDRHGDELDTFPGAVVGEWSKARPPGCEVSPEDFFAKQIQVYSEHATHGCFFWTWTDGAGSDWEFPKDRDELDELRSRFSPLDL